MSLGVDHDIHRATGTDDIGYLDIYILYFANSSICKKEPGNIAGSNPTVSTTPNTIQATELLRPPATPLGVANQQICKLQTASSDLSIYAQESLIGLCYS